MKRRKFDHGVFDFERFDELKVGAVEVFHVDRDEIQQLLEHLLPLETGRAREVVVQVHAKYVDEPLMIMVDGLVVV